MAGMKAPLIGGLALEWLEHDARARLIVDSDLRVIWGNQRAFDTASLIESITLEGNAFDVKDSTQREDFHKTLASLKNDHFTWWPLDQDSPYIAAMNVTRLQSEKGVYFGIEIFTDNPRYKREYLSVSDRLKLTSSESGVLHCLLDGKTPQEVAAIRSVGLDTIRAHIRAVYGKLDVSNREQLFSRLSSFRR